MASIAINDLEINEELDRQAQENISGGWTLFWRRYSRRCMRRYNRIRYRVRYRIRYRFSYYRIRITRWRFGW